MPQRLCSVLKTCQRAVGLPQNTPKNIKFASYSMYTTSSQRHNSVHTTFPQHLYSVFTECTKRAHSVLTACTAFDLRIKQLFKCLKSRRACNMCSNTHILSTLNSFYNDVFKFMFFFVKKLIIEIKDTLRSSSKLLYIF